MALNAWWDGMPDQRYWMEITQREVLGDSLLAPQLDGAGRPSWSYALVAAVEPGDRVLHYKTNATGGAAVVGWSEVTGRASAGVITWQARGTRGRARGVATTGPSWFVPLGGLHVFETPVRGKDLLAHEIEIRSLRSTLEGEYKKPIYFPFMQYAGGDFRAQQGYLAKWPAELLVILPELSAVQSQPGGEIDEELPEEAQPRRKPVPKGKLTRIQDPVLRSAIEHHAVAKARAYYEALGGSDFHELGKPYDLKLQLDGQERQVEVKGSSLPIETVELTTNEVIHASEYQPTDLVVVDKIQWKRLDDGSVVTSGGHLRIWSDWIPDDEDLDARKFAYNLPLLP